MWTNLCAWLQEAEVSMAESTAEAQWALQECLHSVGAMLDIFVPLALLQEGEGGPSMLRRIAPLEEGPFFSGCCCYCFQCWRP